jgi:glycosyltransferase involved in cell wall biosynthesis
MQAGLDAARGRSVAMLDADLQNDPRDIPAMLDKLSEGYDMVADWRANRQDAFSNRKLPSMIANRILVLGDAVVPRNGMTIDARLTTALFSFIRRLPLDVRTATHPMDDDDIPLFAARANVGAFETLQP